MKLFKGLFNAIAVITSYLVIQQMMGFGRGMGFAMGYRGGEGGEMLDVIIMTIFLLVVMMVTGGVDLLYTFFLKCKKLQRVCLITRFSLGALGVGYGFITGRAFSSLAFVAVLLVALGILQLVYMWMQKKGIKV